MIIRIFQKLHNDRGVALLIVLLVTTLLIALIFEFAYATRVSMRAAVNFRDSQRAYFLALSGVNVFAKYNELLDNLPQGEWGAVPIVSTGDTVLQIKWEDESGKISIPMVASNNDSHNRLKYLFEIKQVNQEVLDSKIVPKQKYYLLTELHEVMRDEDYGKVKDFLTATDIQKMTGAAVQKININTAPLEVLQSLCRSLGKDDGVMNIVDNKRKEKPLMKDPAFKTTADIVNFPGMDPVVASYLDVTSNVFKVYSYATVSGFTKTVEAIIQKSPYQILYWRAL